jgi:hypothetical protein
MKIAIFPEYGSLNSQPVFEALIQHLQSKNEKIMINQYDNTCDVAVIWSVLWQGRMEKNKKVWDDFRSQGKPVVVLEVGGLRRNITWKMGINGINRDADFANHIYDDKRWPLFKLELKPWKQTGNVIVICGQHNTSEQWKNLPKPAKWCEDHIKIIRKYCDKPIVIRPHPRNYFEFDVKKYPHVRLNKPGRDWTTYDDTDFKKILNSTWAVINHSSNPAIEAVINGIPVFVSESSLCHDVGNTNVADILHPAMPARQNWANRIAYTEWTTEEIREGLPWKRIRERLLEKYIK